MTWYNFKLFGLKRKTNYIKIDLQSFYKDVRGSDDWKSDE